MFLSAAGGGKTSLMRLFTPGPLLELHKYKDVEGYRELYETMKGFSVMAEEGPCLLGILLSCDRGYAGLADIGLDVTKHIRLLFALLDTRLLLAALRHALALRRIKSEDQLSRLTLLRPPVPVDLPGLTLPCTGDALHSWARSREDEICAALDSFDPEATSAPGSDGLQALDLLKPDTLLLDDKPVADQILIMFDDAQKLTTLQRERFNRFILDKRSTTPVWIAERLEALTRDELLSLGSIEGRDYEPVYLEAYWRDYPKRFENVVNSIADRRVQGSRTIEMFQFDKCLDDTLEGPDWELKFQDAFRVVSERVKVKATQTNLFDVWVAEREAFIGSAYQKAVLWRELEILIERELRKQQKTLGFTLESSTLADKSDNSLKAAAELFLATEFKLPYYYGPATLAKLSSSNIQQYLGCAAQEFEEIISAVLINPQQPPLLPASRQEAILTRASRDMWDEIPRRATHGSQVKLLLQSIGAFSRWYTERPTAPNDPGVNAIAISMSDRQNLLSSNWLRHRPKHRELAEVLASALAHNYLDAQPDYKCKGELWLILNLNRLLCVRYHLPLNYGKFKEQRLDDLIGWMERGFDPKRQSEDVELL